LTCSISRSKWSDSVIPSWYIKYKNAFNIQYKQDCTVYSVSSIRATEARTSFIHPN
jgi:hypothetical protein